MLLQKKNTLRPHVKQKVEDREVGKEPVTPGIYLIVRTRREAVVGSRMFGVDGGSQVNRIT